MLSHVFTSVGDFERAYRFYSAVLAVLQIAPRFHDPAKPWAGWQSAGAQRPLFLIGHPFDGHPHQPGHGQMVAFQAATRAQVDQAYHLALSLGAADDGAPGLRPHYHDHYYGAYFRDPDGNKLCVVCHAG